MPRRPITSIYIICEGQNTEPIYLERIKEKVEDDNFLAISIYPDKSDEYNKTDAIGLINEAIENKSNYDEIYVVYDMDGYSKHEEAFELINEHSRNIHLVFSSIAFETWVLLHFERCSSAYKKSKEIIEQKFVTGPCFLTSYEKKGAFDLFPQIEDKTKTALINSAWLRYIQLTEIESKPIYNINPYTDVDFLVKRLFEINENYCFLGLGNELNLDSIRISLKLENDMLFVKVINEKQISFTTNQLLFYNDKEFEEKLALDANILAPNDSFTFEFTDFDDLNLKFDHHLIFFDIS